MLAHPVAVPPLAVPFLGHTLSRVRALLSVPLLLMLFALSGSLLVVVGQATGDGSGIAATEQKTVAQDVAQELTSEDARVIIDGTQGGNVYEINRTVEVRGSVHGVMVIGGDAIVRGRVEGDVATIGGSVFQAQGSFIGGDVIVLGGAYHHGKAAPGRNPSSATVMVAGLEDELRELARSPSSLLAPQLTPAYLGGRLLAVLFWFIVSLALTAVVPGTVSRAGARLQLTSIRVALIGFVSFVVILCGVPVSLRFLPAPLAAFVGMLSLLLVLFAYLFGRVVLHAVTGRLLQRLLFPARRGSESLALLLGVLSWVFLLSLPYVWTLIAGGLLVVSLGLGLTARTPMNWRRAPDSPPLYPRGDR